MQRLLLAGCVALALSGCASIFSGTTQDVAIRTTPGAKFAVTNSFGNKVASGTVGEDATAQMNLVRNVGYFSPHAYKVKFSKPGYKPQTVQVDPGINAWYFGNILFGGFIGMVIVDPLTGAMFRMVPTTENAPLEPTGEDIAALEAAAILVKRTANNPISRHDYTARRVATNQACQTIGNPDVAGLNTYRETLTFGCMDGRQITVVCTTGDGCRS